MDTQKNSNARNIINNSFGKCASNSVLLKYFAPLYISLGRIHRTHYDLHGF